MAQVVVAVVLLVGVIALTPLAHRTGLPQPVLLTVFGLALALVPSVPTLHVAPDLILPVVLPPLLFAATQRSTAREFRENAAPVTVLAVGLTLASMAVAAAVAHVAGLGWLPALVLGALVSPPDPVAATAVARRLRLPPRMVTILEGEGMFNDATALVAFTVALSATVTGEVSAARIGTELALALCAGVAVGLGLGWLANRLLAVIHDGYAETTVTVLVPFLAYLLAEEVHGSGVLAVLVLGLYLRTYGHQATTSHGWLLGRAVWSYADFLITSLVFALVGLELVDVIGATPVDRGTVVLAGSVVTALVVLRAAWVFGSVGVVRRWASRREHTWPANWREATVVSWAGMRGVVTVAAALAIPATVSDGGPFPFRDEIVVVGLATVLVTLVVQGLTLAPLVARLGVGRDDDEAGEVARLRSRATAAALEELRGGAIEGVGEAASRAAILQYEGYVSAQEALMQARESDGPDGSASEQLGLALGRATDVERSLVLAERQHGQVSPASADEVLRDIESRALRGF